MLFASPHAGLRLVLRDVICFHSPMVPAHTSGGRLNDCRIMAAVFPSAARLTAAPQPLALISSSVFHRPSIFPLAGSTLASAAPPSIHSPNRILPPWPHVSQLAE